MRAASPPPIVIRTRLLRALWLLAFAGFLAGRAPAQGQDSDEAALALADRTPSQPSVPRTCLGLAEVAVSDTTWSDGAASSGGGRTSLEMRCDGAFADGWRAVFSDRLDELWGGGASAQTINTLKEAYLSWRASPSQLFDVGRINVREGVALAYNPTDYFRADAIRNVISLDPDSLRDERLGTVMARLQTLWSSGSLTAIYAPRFDARPSDSSFSPDFGATNGESRWVLILSERLADPWQPQWSLTGTDGGRSLQGGLDLTYLLNRSTVAYLEWAGGRSASNVTLSGSAPAATPDDAFRSRVATGMTYTTASKLSVSLEYEYDGAAPDGQPWAALRSGPLAPYVRYRDYAAAQQELTTRQNVFGYAQWQDAAIPRLDLTLFLRLDPYDHSRLPWAEARYHWERLSIAIQWQGHTGAATSDLAPWPVHQSWLALIDYYL